MALKSNKRIGHFFLAEGLIILSIKEANMEDLLSKIATENKVDYALTQEILKIEKDHVYQKSRHTRGPIKELIISDCTEAEK